MKGYQEWLIDDAGNKRTNVNIEVRVANSTPGAGAKATIFANAAGAAKANPFTNLADGSYSFFANDGRYDVVLNPGTVDQKIIAAVEVVDGLDLSQRAVRVATGETVVSVPPLAERTGDEDTVWAFDKDTGEAKALPVGSFPPGPQGPPGTNNTVATLEDLAALDTDLVSAIAAGATFIWKTGDYSALVDGVDYVASDDLPATTGAWVRIGQEDLRKLGAFSGSTIPDNQTPKQAMQALETAVETKATAAAVGVTATASNLGTFTSPLIDDNQTVKAAIESIGTNLAATTGAGFVGIEGQNGASDLDAEIQKLLFAVPDPRRFGVVADGTTDDTEAWQAWIDYCADNNIPFFCAPRLNSKITDTLTIPRVMIASGAITTAAAIDLRNVSFTYTGPRDRIALDIGEAPGLSGYYPETDIFLPRISTTGTLSWPGALGTSDIGIRLRQAFRCRIMENYVYGFTNGIVYSGCAYNTIFAKHISDCKYGLVCTTEGSNLDASFFNENTRFGGKIGNTSTAAALGNSYQIVFTWDKTSSYRLHNANRFIAPCLEGNNAATYQLPILFDGVGGVNSFEHVRLEGERGPVAIFDGGGGVYACGTTIELDYIASSNQEISMRQVNGACGNRLLGVGCQQTQWNSGDMSRLVSSAGAAGAAHIRGREFFFINAGTPSVSDIKKTDTAVTTAIKSNRRGINLDAGGYARVGVAIDASRIKDFCCSYQSSPGLIGRPVFFALDANGAFLTGNATETFVNPLTGSAYSNEPYVKATPGTSDAGNVLAAGGNGFAVGSDTSLARVLYVTVRPEVQTLLFCIVGGSTQAVVQSMNVEGYSTYNTIGEAYPLSTGRASVRVFSPLDDNGENMLASANPGTAGTLGYFSRGDVVLNNAAASAAASGWQCTLSGFLAPAWAGSTAYAATGALVINDTGKVYELLTAGTSASSGGPTGTGSSITDGTCVWRYAGVQATFVAMANNA